MAINTSFQISFGVGQDASQGHLSAEIDDRVDGLNGGNTRFVPGDVAWFLVYKSANVSYQNPIPSAGSVSGGGAITVEIEEDISFADTDTATLRIPANAITSITWLGNSLGGLTLTDPQTVRASAKGVAVARVRFQATAYAHALQSPASVAGLTDFSILVYILGNINA
jgi:hypothetical protein